MKSSFIDAFFQRVIEFTGFTLLEAPLAKRTTGVVRWFDGSRGYGYIDAKDGEDVFVTYRDITGEGLQLLSPGEQVGFYLEISVRGPHATDVTRLN